MPPNAPECPTRSHADAPRMPRLQRAILWPLAEICGLRSGCRGAFPTPRGEQPWDHVRSGAQQTQARCSSQLLPTFRAGLIQTGSKLGKNWGSALFLISPHSQVVLYCLARRAYCIASPGVRIVLPRQACVCYCFPSGDSCLKRHHSHVTC